MLNVDEFLINPAEVRNAFRIQKHYLKFRAKVPLLTKLPIANTAKSQPHWNIPLTPFKKGSWSQ